jgi:hypothetical protein
MFIEQLTIKEIDQIISFLQDPYPYELIKRLEKLKAETLSYIQIKNKLIMDKMEEERQINEHGFGTSPVKTAYFEITNEKI